MPASRILIIYSLEEIRDLLDLTMREAGYQVEVTADFTGVVERLEQRRPEERPALIVLEVRSALPPSLEVLDRLRLSPALRAIPVLALVTLEGDAALARARLNVYGVIELPFEMADLLNHVEQVLGLRRLPIPPPSRELGPNVLATASDLLMREQPTLLLRWAQRVAIRGLYPQSRVRTSELLDHSPLLLKALLATWHPDAPEIEELSDPGTELHLAVSEHIRQRRRLGTSASVTVQEYTLLRAEIWRTFREKLPDLPAQDVYLLGERVNSALDRLLSLTLRLYEEQTRAG